MDTEQLREKTHLQIKKMGFEQPIPLPFLEKQFSFKSVVEIANRINILHVFYAIYLRGIKSYSYFQDILYENKYDVYLTGKEQLLFETGTISEQDIINFAWGKESAKTLIWMGSLFEEDFFSSFEECDFSKYYHLIPPENSDSNFINSYILRKKIILLQHLDFYYCLHWLCKNYPEEIDKANTEISYPVIIERRKAFEWVANSDDWDHVDLST